jgi:hypothetical protein
LDQESISVEPRKEDLSDDIFNSRLFELKTFGSHNRRVAKIKSASISTVGTGNEKRIGVVLLTLGHFLTIRGENDSIDDQVLERSLSLDSS